MIRNILKIEYFEKFKWNFENIFFIIRVINKIYDLSIRFLVLNNYF